MKVSAVQSLERNQARRSCASSTTRSWLSSALFARYWQPWLDTGILRTMVYIPGRTLTFELFVISATLSPTVNL